MAAKAPLVIVGAGGFGREVAAWAEPLFEVIGFQDDNPSALERFGSPYPILGPSLSPPPSEEVKCLIAIGSCLARKRVAQKLEAIGWKFATLIHPTSIIGPRVEIGEGTMICPMCILTTDIRVGRHVLLNCQTVLGHDCQIGDFCTLNCHSEVTGFGVLEEGVFLGTHAALTPGVRVGRQATVGAGSIAFRKVPEGTTVLGVPAQKLMVKEIQE